MSEEQWRDQAWLIAAHDWIDARLGAVDIERTGPIEQPHVRPWSTVLRIPTNRGDLWFKANAGSFAHEAGVVERLAARCPDVVPPPLATDIVHGWMLMTDGGETLRVVTGRERSLDRWLDVLARYASVQLDSAPDVDDLLALGVPDRRLSTLPDAYARLLDEIGAEPRFHAAAPMVAELCETLAGYDLPATIQHDDLHDGQVFVHESRHLILDWGDACVSHPFFTLAVTLEGQLAWGLDDVENSVDLVPFQDAYLKPFTEHYPGDLAAAIPPALRLGWACRAINGHLPNDTSSTITRLRMFLDGHP